MLCLISSEKYFRMSSAAVVIGALRVHLSQDVYWRMSAKKRDNKLKDTLLLVCIYLKEKCY